MVMAAGGGGGGSNKPPPKPKKKVASVVPGVNAGAQLGAGVGSQDPMAILAALTEGNTYPGGGGGTQDYYAQAQQVYDPQTDYLDKIERDAKNQAASSGKSLDALYAELARSIGAQAGGIKKNYGDATAASKANYASSYGDVKNSFDASRNGMAETLARLGIQEAAPNAVGKETQMQALMQGILTANNQAQTNFLGANKQSTLDYNQANQTGAKLKGGEAREGLASQLGGFLQELGLKRADLQSKISQWAIDKQGQAESQAYDQWKDSRDFNQQASQFGADLKYKYDALGAKGASSSGSKGPDPYNLTKLDPVGAINVLANSLYGGNQQAAGNATKAITDTLQYGGQPQSLKEFVDEVMRRNNNSSNFLGSSDAANLTQLANLYYQKAFGK